MKNVISKTKYVLMALIIATTFSCSPEDGADGAQGIQGIPGQDGTNGIDGIDGNANVQTLTFDASAMSGSSFDLVVPEITQSVMDNDVVLLYLQIGSVSYLVPGPGANGNYVTRSFLREGELLIRFLNWDGTSFSVTAGGIDEIKIIIIEST